MQLNKAKNKFMTCVTGRKTAVKVPAKKHIQTLIFNRLLVSLYYT